MTLLLALTTNHTVPNVNPPNTEMALKRRKTSRKMVSSLGRNFISHRRRERERWSNPSFHRRASNSRKKKKKKTSRDHVLGENGKSEDVAEDSSLKQQPSEGNREQESEFCSTLFLVQPAHTNAVLFNRDIHTRTHTVTVGRTHTQMYYTTISSHIYLA